MEAGWYEDALKTAELVGDPNFTISKLQEIAEEQKKTGDADAAQESLRQALTIAEAELAAIPPDQLVPDEVISHQRNIIHAAIARLHAKLGDVEQAAEAARRISDSGAEIESQQEIARIVAGTGDLATAMSIVDSINSPEGQAKALEGVAAALPRRENAAP